MKKLMKRLAVVLLVLTAVYTAVAWFLLRGLGAYRLGTTVGTILAYSWQYTGLAALILLVWAVMMLLRRKKAGNKKLQTAAPQAPDASIPAEQPEEGETTGKKARRRKGKDASGGKIAPAMAQSPGKLPPNGPMAPASPVLEDTLPMPEDYLEPTRDMPVTEPEQTMPMPQEDAPAATELMPDGDLTTMPMPEEAVILEPAAPVPSGPVCPRCQAPVKPGAKFCGKCGMKLGG